MAINQIVSFLSGLGFHVERTLRTIDDFLPGISIDGMSIYVNTERLVNVGDLLHEAGHVAIVPSMFRHLLVGGDIMQSIERVTKEYLKTHFIVTDGKEDPICRALIQCGEAESLAWSYAAAIGAGIDPALVFHENGYEGEHESILIRMQLNSHFGINGLAAAGMTTVKMFPKMIRWLQL